MAAIQGFALLLVLQSIGELLSRGLSLPVPGPVVGMLLLLVALNWRVVREPVAACAPFLLSHLSLLFIPVAVGITSYLPLLGTHWLRLLLVIVVSTWIGLAVTVLALRRFAPPPDAHDTPQMKQADHG
ncbi:MAG: CidA/LrgA family protein [Ramlibacter sp.]|jgi:putative effector of murein hydrolase LrgA (UPF0299 family)